VAGYQLIIFDFDGTLLDTAPDIALYANEVLRSRGYTEQTLPRVKKAVGRGVHELFKELEPSFKEGSQELEDAVAAFKRRYWARPVVHTKPYDGVLEMLAGPLSKFKKAIVTNKPHDLTQKILQTLSLSGFFDKVIGLDLGYPPKPDPASVLQLMGFFGAGRTDTLYIGDSNVDAETCRNARIDFAWVEYGYDKLSGLAPAFTFSSAFEWRKLQ